jgi:hypothetical protein
MKTLISLFTIAMLGWFTVPALAQPEPQFTLATNIEVEDVDRLVFHPEGDVVLNFWGESYIKVEVEISAPGFRRNQVKALVPLGVFNLQTEIKDQTATVEMPRLKRPVTVGGKVFKPNLRFHLSLPAHMEIEKIQTSRDTVAGNL